MFLGKILDSHSASLATAQYKWVPVNLMLEVTLRWTSCFRNWNKLRRGGPLGLYADVTFTKAEGVFVICF